MKNLALTGLVKGAEIILISLVSDIYQMLTVLEWNTKEVMYTRNQKSRDICHNYLVTTTKSCSLVTERDRLLSYNMKFEGKVIILS